MKKILFILLAVAAVVSCKNSLPDKFTSLADKVEKKCDKFTEEDWDKANDLFEDLVDEYIDEYDSFTKEEKKEINAAIGKYSAVALKSGVTDVIKDVQDIITDIPSSINNLLDSAKGLLQDLGMDL